MAANNPPVLAVIPALAANNPLFGEDPVYLDAGQPLVSATASFMDWQPVVAVAGLPAQVSAPFHRMLFAFGIRCKISPVPANLAAARALNPFTMRFHAACWSRVLTELSDSGLALPGTVYYTVAAFHEAIVGLQLQNPMNLYIGAADWNAAPALAALTAQQAGGQAGVAAAAARHAAIAFIAAASLPSLEINTGKRATSAPWSAIALLVGAMGPARSNPQRLAADSQVLIVATDIRGDRTAPDAVLAASLGKVLAGSLLPPVFRSHSADQASVLLELQAGLRYRLGEDDKLAVEEDRIYQIDPWCPACALPPLSRILYYIPLFSPPGCPASPEQPRCTPPPWSPCGGAASLPGIATPCAIRDGPPILLAPWQVPYHQARNPQPRVGCGASGGRPPCVAEGVAALRVTCLPTGRRARESGVAARQPWSYHQPDFGWR